jgi:hypothetical protein
MSKCKIDESTLQPVAVFNFAARIFVIGGNVRMYVNILCERILKITSLTHRTSFIIIQQH